VKSATVSIGALELASGARLDNVIQRVTIYGEPNADGSNVVLIAHALTGSAAAMDWWPGLVGEDRLFDPVRYCIVGINAVGGCYGSTGPASLAADGKPYGSRFPIITVRDIVDAQVKALEHLGITRVAHVIGGSLGGMQALDWGLRYGDIVEHAIVVGAFDAISAMGIALNTVAREAIYADPNYRGGDYYEGEPPSRGVRHARMIAMLSYKSDVLLQERFANRVDRKGGDPWRNKDDRFDVEGYLAYQGDIFVKRMDANSYLALTRAMDLFDTSDYPLDGVRTRLTFVGIENDWLFPAPYVRAAVARFAAARIPATYLFLPSNHGHDAFLAEDVALGELLRPAVERIPAGNSS
jgi:homoserine O-acetyltransferase/O-succinyltransferase